MRWMQYGFLLVSCWTVCIIAARTISQPAAGWLPGEYDPVAIGLEGKRLDWNVEYVPLEELVEQMSERYGVQLELDALEAPYNFSTPIPHSAIASLKVINATLAEAILGLMIAEEGDDVLVRLGYSVLGRTVVIRSEGFSMTGRVLRAYDIKPLMQKLVPHANRVDEILPRPSEDVSFGYPSLFRDREIGQAIQEHVWQVATIGGIMHGPETVWRAGGVLFVETTPELQQQVVQTLNAMSVRLDELGPPK